MATIMPVDEAGWRHWVSELNGADALAIERLDRISAMLAEENERQNLVSKATLGSVWERHIADSAQLLTHVSRETEGLEPWLDLGTGAGFPGLVIACLRPDQPMVMVESRARRVEWLERVICDLGLGRARVEGRTLEKVPSFSASYISARAFAPLELILKLSSRFSTAQTFWLLPKGRSAAKELQELSHKKHRFHVKQSLTDAESGVIVGYLPNQ